MAPSAWQTQDVLMMPFGWICSTGEMHSMSDSSPRNMHLKRTWAFIEWCVWAFKQSKRVRTSMQGPPSTNMNSSCAITTTILMWLWGPRVWGRKAFWFMTKCKGSYLKCAASTRILTRWTWWNCLSPCSEDAQWTVCSECLRRPADMPPSRASRIEWQLTSRWNFWQHFPRTVDMVKWCWENKSKRKVDNWEDAALSPQNLLHSHTVLPIQQPGKGQTLLVAASTA